jgi:hypothetical protein
MSLSAKVGKAKSNKGKKGFKRTYSKKYAVLRNGSVFYFKDNNKEYTVLKADNYNSYFLGKSKIRNSTRPQSFRKANWRCNYLYHSFKKVLEDYDVDVDKCVIVTGSYDTNQHTLQRTMIPEVEGKFSEHPNPENVKIFQNVIKVMFRKMKMYGKLETPSFDSVYHTRISKDKKPGFRYEECFKMHTKKDALPSALKIAKVRWDYLSNTRITDLKRENMCFGVYTIGARNKRDHTYEDDELAISRAVHMPELHVELTTAPWFDSFTDRIKEVQKGPIYIGNSILSSNRLKKDIEDSKFVLEGDFKRFDSTLYLIAITCGLAFSRCFYDLNSDYVDSHFCGIYDSLALKDYYTVGGKVFRMFHGLPSGVKCTCLLGSIINLMTLLFCVKKNFKNFNFIVGGDDFLLSSNKGMKGSELFVNKVKNRIKLLGMRFKFLDIKYYNSDSINECPTFYKYCIYKGHAVTPTQAMLERVLMPWNKKYDSDIEMFKFLKDVMPSLGEPMSHLYIYYKFYQHMYNAVTGNNIPMSHILRKHKKLNAKMTLSKDVKLLHKYKVIKTDDVVSTVSYVLETTRNVRSNGKLILELETFI